MRDVDVGRTRNFALIGHSADGKTSLGEALLHAAGATPEPGRVDDGTSVLDSGPEERERHHTLSTSVYGFDWNGYHLTLADTPGDPSFQADGRIVLRALDGAVLVVSGVDGAKVGSETMGRAAREAGLPLVAFVNGLDRERADFDAALASLRKLEGNPVPLFLPVGTGPELRGVVDLRRMKAIVDGEETAVPEALADAAASAREELVESVAECDDALLERYLEEGALTEEEIERGLLEGARAGRLVPVLCGAALSGVGAAPALEALTHLLPSPKDRPPFRGRALADGADAELAADPSAPFAAVVVKTIVDRYAGTLSLFRVISGRARPELPIANATRGGKAKLGKLLLLRGAEHPEVPEAGPGDLVAVAKLKDVHTGDALAEEKGGVAPEALPLPEGVLSYAIRAREGDDEDKVFAALGRLAEEDPTLHLARDPATREFLLTGMGELHIRVTLEKLRRLQGTELDLQKPKVPYRETLTRAALHEEGKLKKQTGGKGMFGVCYLSVEPLPRGSGLEFVDEVTGGAIPRGLIPAVEKGVREAAEAGPLAGYPVVDVRVRCVDGKHHPVDSNEMAFKLAGSFAFKAALEKGRPTLLEPVMRAEVAVPDEHVGDVMGDLAGRRGRVQSTEARGTSQVIKAEVPMAEMLEYANALTSLTGGKGAFHMEFSHYDEVPAASREKVAAEARARAAERA